MSPGAETVRVQLSYPIERVREPILYQLVIKFGLVPNIRRAAFDVRSGGFIALELSGDSGSLEEGLRWLEEMGIAVSPVGVDATQEWST